MSVPLTLSYGLLLGLMYPFDDGRASAIQTFRISPEVDGLPSMDLPDVPRPAPPDPSGVWFAFSTDLAGPSSDNLDCRDLSAWIFSL